MVPPVGLEPTTSRLRAGSSAAELRRLGLGRGTRTPNLAAPNRALYLIELYPVAPLPGFEPGPQRLTAAHPTVGP